MGEIKRGRRFPIEADPEPLCERDMELVDFLGGKEIENENTLQRNYRLNRIKEFEEEMDKLLSNKHIPLNSNIYIVDD